MSLLELIASYPPSRPRNGTTSFTVTSSFTRGLRVLPRQTVKCRHFVPTAWWERCVVDEFSSTASGEGLKNICSVGALPGPDISNYPELNCVFPLDNEFDFASSEVLEGLKVDNIKPQKLFSSSRLW